MPEKTSRCWPGYEPVPGKEEHEQGSCRKKAESKSSPSEKQFQQKRQEQLDEWQKEHKGTRRSAAQHLHAPGQETKTGTARKKAAAKTAAKKKRAPAKKKRSR